MQHRREDRDRGTERDDLNSVLAAGQVYIHPLKGSSALPGKQRLETCRETSQAAQSLSCWSLDTEKGST